MPTVDPQQAKTRLASSLAALAREWADSIWPVRCWLCGAALARGSPGDATGDVMGGACEEHALGTALAGNRCGRCASTLAPGLTHGVLCRACRTRPPRFRAVHAASDYSDDAVRSWLLAFKHGGRADLAVPLAEHVARSLGQSLARPDGHPAGRPDGLPHRLPHRLPHWAAGRRLLVPVPLHPVRLVERGYDQASLLAACLAGHGLGPCVPLLRRVRPTQPQGSELAENRRTNVRGAFRCRARIPPGTAVVLVDDVLASGATADACAAALRKAGAADVRVLVVARA